MKLKEIIVDTAWEDIESSLVDLYNVGSKDLERYSEWLGMEIDSETANNIEIMKSDIIAHCFWEMTYISYDEENIEKEKETLREAVKKIFQDKEIKVYIFKDVY